MSEPSPDRPTIAYKIVEAFDWATVPPGGAYAGAPVDLADGYIHLSTEAQWRETAQKHFAGQVDLLLLTVDLTRLGPTVVWEPSRGGALFPHIYGSLPVFAVTGQRRLAVDPDGTIHVSSIGEG